MSTVVTVLGARPQFVKAGPVSRALAEAGFREHLLHTGQHHDPELSQVFFDEIGLPDPSWHLGIAGGPHGQMIGRMLEAVERRLVSDRPDAVLVYGDTNSTLAGALAAAKLHVPVVHIEAGLRSDNRGMPEELNRVLTDHMADLLLAPTRTAVHRLASEGIHRGVHHVGDVMFDATLQAAERATSRPSPIAGLVDGQYAVATVHRAENTDDPVALATVMGYLRDVAEGCAVVLPLHPRTRNALKQHDIVAEGLTLLPPLGYLDMTRLVSGAIHVYTDSGGLQKEAYFHRVPCTTLRAETEWVETVACGWNRLWRGADYLPRRDIEDYGDGHAAEHAVKLIQELLA